MRNWNDIDNIIFHKKYAFKTQCSLNDEKYICLRMEKIMKQNVEKCLKLCMYQ